MSNAQLIICVLGAKESGECTPPRCYSRRIMNREVRLVCQNTCSKELLDVLERLDEQSVKILQNICVGIGGCAEALIVDDKLCCITRLESMPGLRALSDVMGTKGVTVSLERGSIKLCVKHEGDIKKVVEKIRDAFLVLESVYDTQRRIAEGVAKSISMMSGSPRISRARETREGSEKKRER